MKNTYLLIDILSISIPLLYSFHPKMKLIRWWKPIFIALTITAIYFLVWDIFFTKHGIWGFNDKYLTGYKVLGLPIEEWLFFWMIPYASLFIYYSLQYFKSNWQLSVKVVTLISNVLLVISLILVLTNLDRWYTLINGITFISILTFALFYKQHLLRRFYIAFLIILVPFTLVNGVLTGMFTNEPVVWYNNLENMGKRFISIPFEDFGYAFSMLLLSLIIIDSQVKIKWNNSQ